MRHHIALKFLAVLLCALTLLGSFVCVIGIAVLEQNGLYESDVPSMETDYRERLLTYAAKNVLRRYATATLSGCPKTLIEQYYGLYSRNEGLVDGGWFYTITDPSGTVVETDVPNHRSDLIPYPVADLSTWYSELVEGPVKSEQYTGEHSRDPMLTPTEPDSLDPARPDAGGVYGFIYWDNEVNGYMETKLRDVRIEGYTVTIHYNDTSFTERSDWQLLTLAWKNRYNIITALILCLLLFAVGAVYLCCAAGRKPGGDEIKAGGFNALPLDLYTGLVLFLSFLTYEVVDEFKYWFDYSNFVFFWFLLFAGFFVCLLFVGYCFAWAAQIKEGNGRW